MKRSLIVILAVSLVAGVPAADAARPILGAKYRGRTAQDAKLVLRVAKNRREIQNIQALLNTNCAELGGLNTQGLDVSIKVSRKGRFSSTFIEARSLESLFRPVVVAGRERNVFDVTKARITGRFVTRNRVRGSWRLRSLIYDEDGYPDAATPVDRCDTSSVGFSARRVR